MATPADDFDDAHQRQMAEAIVDGAWHRVKSLLENRSVLLSDVGRNQTSWLLIAMLTGQREIFDELVGRKAFNALPDTAAGVVMYHAVVDDERYWLEALHQAGAALDRRGGGDTLIQTAADSKLPDRLAWFIEHHADLEMPTTLGNTTFVQTIMTGNYEAATQLLEAGASPWAIGMFGWTAMHWLQDQEMAENRDIGSEADLQREALTKELVELGLPYPPPPPEEVLALEAKGLWGK